MFLNYLRHAIRLLFRNPFFTGINVLGLSVGFAAFYVLWPYAQSELNTDRFHRDYEHIARISWHHRWTDDNQNWDEMYHPLNFFRVTHRIATEFSQIDSFTRVVPQSVFTPGIEGIDKTLFFSLDTATTNERYAEKYVILAEANFFTFFSFPLLAGNPEQVLREPNSVVISETHAHKYFGTRNPIDKIIYLNDSVAKKVTGVFKSLPEATHFRFDMVLSSTVMDKDAVGTSNSVLGATYVRVHEGVDLTVLENTINQRRAELYGRWHNADPQVFIQPLKDIAFVNLLENPFKYKSRSTLIILRVLAFIILILAWINYISLSINKLHKRLPEIGTRKVAGARSRDFIVQFLIEAALINLLAFLAALTLVQLVRVPISYLFHFYVPQWDDMSVPTVSILVCTILTSILVTGLYPVLVSFGRKPHELLKKLRTTQMPWWINGMVTCQYAAAIILLIWIGSVYFQIDFIIHRDIGVEQERIIVLDFPMGRKNIENERVSYFMEEISKVKGIQGATTSETVVGDATSFPTFLQRTPNSAEVAVESNGGVDENFMRLFGVRLFLGRNFLPDNPADRRAILLSRETTKRLGFSTPDESMGEEVILREFTGGTVKVIGVYEDYAFRPFFSKQTVGQGSLLTYKNFLLSSKRPTKISVKLAATETQPLIAEVEKIYHAVFPEDVFRMNFLDDNVARHYADEKISRNQIMLFTLLSIGIACLGLLGIISNRALEKTKEIGVRKVMGARVYQIAQLLVSTTAWQVLIANVIGIPVAYFLAQQYLEKFSERMTLQWWHYAIPIALLLLIMLATIGSVLLKTARANPVESLRYE